MNEVLEKFAMMDAREGELVKLRYFTGLSFEEAAGVLGIAVPAAKQWWACARAWLRAEMSGGSGTVYVAEQTEPVRRRVALKVIKLGMDTREVIASNET